MKFLHRLLIVLPVLAAVVLAVSYLAPLPIPYVMDFSVMYFTNKGLLSGIPIYAYSRQLPFVKALTQPGFTFLPFPYPPWYALATIYISLMPVQAAARIWFFMNIGMIALAAWLLTPGWKGPTRIFAALAAIMFIPAFGLLMVGQYSAPILLGPVLFVYAARRECRSPSLAALGLLLVTFKPHIGAILLLAGLAWLVFEGSPFAQRALWLTLAGGLLLALLGFIADPAWPLTYFQSLMHYRDIPGVQTCGLCASLPVALLTMFTGHSSTLAAAGLSLVLLPAFAVVLFWRYRRARRPDPEVWMALAVVITLLVDPYLLNYDYILLLMPLIWLVRRERLALIIYFMPWCVLVLGRTTGNILLVLGGIMTFILILRHPIDLSDGEAYNQSTIK